MDFTDFIFFSWIDKTRFPETYSLAFKIILTNYWNSRPTSYTHSETLYNKIELFIWKSKVLNSVISHERPSMGDWSIVNVKCPPLLPPLHMFYWRCATLVNSGVQALVTLIKKSEVEFIIYFLQNLMTKGLVYKVGLTQISSDVLRCSMQLQCDVGDVDVAQLCTLSSSPCSWSPSWKSARALCWPS